MVDGVGQKWAEGAILRRVAWEGFFEEMKEGALWVTWGNSVLGGKTSQGESLKVRS